MQLLFTLHQVTHEVLDPETEVLNEDKDSFIFFFAAMQ